MGGITGGVLLLTAREAFQSIVPVLIALSCVLVIQPWLTRRPMADRRGSAA
jgi:hypothetical protein